MKPVSVDPRAVDAKLAALEQALKDARLWAAVAPPSRAFASTLPFCYDTMFVSDWLQWVFIPRMRDLLAAGAALPERCGVAPYAEEAFTQRPGLRPLEILAVLRELDGLISGERG